jgi:hypothetical protein
MKKIYIPIFMALAFTACQEGNITPETKVVSNEMAFNVHAPGVHTKVTNNTFESLDEIGIYVTDYVNETTPMPLQISGNRANNVTVTYDGAAWTPEQTIYWGEGKSDVYAYYPYISEIQDVESQFFEVATDQTGDGYEGSDLLWAKAEGVMQTYGPVSLQMRHIMSKLIVKIVAGEDYVGSLPDDASVLLHSTVTGARVDLSKGSVSKDPYSGAKSIKMKKIGLRTYEGVQAVVYEAIVVPQMLESSVPLLEINSKSVSYLLEDPFNFRPGVAYTYTATLNTSTTAIKVEIGCELEDWNSTGGDSGDEGESGEGGSNGGDDDGVDYTDLSAAGTANCYLIQGAGNYMFKSVIGNTGSTVGNVKSVEVLWESFGTDEMPNVGDLIASSDYKDGYIRFSTPENFRDGNAVIAAKNSKGTILWSWHIWCAEEGWEEQVYYNDAGTMMDRNLGATSAIPGDVGTIGLMYQWGRKEPFMGLSSFSSTTSFAQSTGVWASNSSKASVDLTETNPMTYYSSRVVPADSWQTDKTPNDPCPLGWRVPDGGENGVWMKSMMGSVDALSAENGLNFTGIMGDDPVIYYPKAGCLSSISYLVYEYRNKGCYLSCNNSKHLSFQTSVNLGTGISHGYAASVRCVKE